MLAQEFEDDPEYLAMLAQTLERRAAWDRLAGLTSEAGLRLAEAREVMGRAVALDPQHEGMRARRVRMSRSIARHQSSLGDDQGALAILRAAMADLDGVRSDFPGVFRFELLAAELLADTATSLRADARAQESRVALDRAASIYLALLEPRSESAHLHGDLGRALLNLADVEHSVGDSELALDTCLRAREHFQVAVSLDPDSKNRSSWLTAEARTRARILSALGRESEAAEALEEERGVE